MTHSTCLGFRHCNPCGRDLPVYEFYKSRRTGRIESGCKECRRERVREQHSRKQAVTS